MGLMRVWFAGLLGCTVQPALTVQPPEVDSLVENSDDTGGEVTTDSGPVRDTGDTGPPPVDADGDGYDASVDCDDADSGLNPGATDWCDGIDQDCDGDPVGAGMCGEGLANSTASDGYWEDSHEEGLGIGPCSTFDGELLCVAYTSFVWRGGWEIQGYPVALVEVPPGGSHDWLDSLVKGWYPLQLSTFFTEVQAGGDVDGDGHGDLWLGSRTSAEGVFDSAYLILGPVRGLGGGFSDASVSRAAEWVGREPDDLFGAFIDADQDVDGDGLSDALLLSNGGVEDPVVALILGRADLDGSTLSVVGESFASVDDSTNDAVMVPPHDGTGRVLLVETRRAALLDIETLHSLAGANANEVDSVVLQTEGYHYVEQYGARADVGDVQGDGGLDLAIYTRDVYLETSDGACALWIPADEVPPPGGYAVGDLTRVCTLDYGSVSTRIVEDLDDDGVRDVGMFFKNDGVDVRYCFLPSTKLIQGTRVDVEEIGLCGPFYYDTTPDMNGDGYPEFQGRVETEVSTVRYEILFGFDIPWDDPTKW